MPCDKKIKMSGIIKHTDGYGFKITFPSPETANKYKDMVRWLFISDGYPLIYKTGYYDMFKSDGYKRKEL